MNEWIFETHVQSDRLLHLPNTLPIGLRVRIMIEPIAADLDAQEPIFPATDFESPTLPSVYPGAPLTPQQMREAIDWEAGQRR